MASRTIMVLISTVAMLNAGIALAGQRKLPERSVLHAQAIEQSMIPVRPGVPGRSPFWNKHARRFIYVPAFDFKEVKDAATYRFTAASKADGKDYVFEALKPWALLTPIWRDLPVGPVVLKVEGLDGQGKAVGPAGTRTIYRAAVFNGPYRKPVVDYRESTRRAMEGLFKQKYFQRWLEDGKPDYASNRLFAYPSKMVQGTIQAMVWYREFCSPDDVQKALGIARAAAKYLIDISQPASTPLEHFPPTYDSGSGFSARGRTGQVMMFMPARVADAYLDLYDVTKDEALLKAAKAIADTYVKTQLDSGTWPLMVKAVTGEPTTKNVCVPVYEILFLDRLVSQYDLGQYQAATDKALRWVMNNPMKTFNWEGQFEDQSITSPPYRNMAMHHVVSLAMYLLDHRGDDPRYVGQAEELLRFGEDQFVVWERPMPREYQRRKDIYPEKWILPCTLEQYDYYTAIDACAAIMILGFQKAYEVTGKELYLAKACALANSMTVAQFRKGPNAGLYMTGWKKLTGDQKKAVLQRPLPFYWINCAAHDIRAMLGLAYLLDKK